MDVSSNICNTLQTDILTKELLAAIVTLIAVIYLIKTLVVPAATQYKLATKLDEIVGFHKRHWFFGHRNEFPVNEDGLLNRARVLPKKHPAMFNFWFAPFLSVVNLYHPETAVSLLTSGAPKDDFIYRFLRPWIGDGLLTSEGLKWRRNRRLLTPAFHFSILKGYTQTFNECSMVLLEKWNDAVNKTIEVSSDVSLMTLDTMLRCAMSSETNCQRIRGRHPYIQAVQDLSRLTVHRMTHVYLLPDFIFWKTKHGKRFKEACDVVHHHANQIIFERRQQLQKSQKNEGILSGVKEAVGDFSHPGKKQLDFLDILLQTKDEEGNGLSEEEIREEVDTFLFEGHDTTASGISFALYNLAKYPDYQEVCRKEVRYALGNKPFVEWDDIPKFNYLTMFIKESLRLYPPVLGIGRKLKKDLSLKSVLGNKMETTLPAGARALLNLFTLHRSEHLWDDPETFDPERFTKENISKRSPHAYLPFSGGSRNCIGQHFAMNEMKTILAQILRRYRLYLDDETPRPELEIRLILQSSNGIRLRLQKL